MLADSQSATSCVANFNYWPVLMKPRLPYVLMAALCAVATPAQAAYNSATNTYGGSDNADINLPSTPDSSRTLIFDIEAGYFEKSNDTYAGNIQIGSGTDDAHRGLVINNGYSTTTTIFSETVTGGGLLSKTASCATNIYFTGDVTGYTGAIQLSSGGAFTLKFGDGQAAPAAMNEKKGVSGTGTITFGTAANTLEYNYAARADGTPVYITNAIKKTGTGAESKVTLSGAAAMEFTQSVTIDTLKIGNSAASVTFHEGSIGTISGTAAGLTKTGAGSLAIGNLGGNTLTLNEGSLTGTLTNGTLAAGTGGTLGTASDGFTLNGGTIDFGTVSTTASLSATGRIGMTSGDLLIGNIAELNTTDTYILLSGSDLTWGSSGFTGITVNGQGVDSQGYFVQTIDGTRYKGQLSTQDGSNSLALNMAELTSAVLAWNGGDGTWQNGTAGWNGEGVTDGSSVFAPYDEVVFSGNSVAETITLAGEITPVSITVSEGDYTFQAGENGRIGGGCTLTVGNGTGTTRLTIQMDDAGWRGSADLQAGGTLVLGHNGALGASTLTFNGGVLEYGTGVSADISSQIAAGGTVKVKTADTAVTWSTNVLAGNAVEKSGKADLTLTLSAGTYTNALTVNEGNLGLNVASGTVTYNGTMSGSGTFVKTGGGTFMTQYSAGLAGAHIAVNGGTFRIGDTQYTSFVSSPASISVASGAALILSGGQVTMDTRMDLAANATLEIFDGATTTTSPDNPTFTITQTVTLGKADITASESAVVHYKSQYARVLEISGKVTGNGRLHMTNTRDGMWGADAFIYLTNADNDFSGGIQIDRVGGYLQVDKAGALGTGILNLNNASSGFKYGGSAMPDGSYDVLKGGAGQIITGAGSVEILSGNLELQGENTYTGTTTVTAGSLKVSGSGSIGSATSSNTFHVASGAGIVLGGSGTIANSGVAVSAKPQTARSVNEASLSNVTINTSGMARTSGNDNEQGVIENGKISITQTADFGIQHILLVNSTVELQSSGSVTLSNVTIGAGTTVDRGTGSITLRDSNLVMTTANTTVGTLNSGTLAVSSTGLAAYSAFSGTLTLNLTKEWIDALCASAGGNFTTIELTFSDVDESAWNAFKSAEGSSLSLSGALDSPMFGPPTMTFGDTAGTVYIVASGNIPEPATATLGLLGLASLMLRRRRKQS